eukprot:jgi/Mesen1/5503/ME000277S04716
MATTIASQLLTSQLSGVSLGQRSLVYRSSVAETKLSALRPSKGKSSPILFVRAAQAEGIKSVVQKATVGLTAIGLSAALQFSPLVADVANANEYDVLGQGAPTTSHVVDDSNVLNRVTKSDIKRLLTDLEERTGYHLDVVTIRKLTSKGDVFEFADNVLEKWYPTIEEGDKKGVVLLVTTAKEGAIAGGPSFSKTIGDQLLEAVIAENLPVLATDEKYNEAMYSSVKRLAAKIDGLPDEGGPQFEESKRVSNFKTKAETQEKRGQFSTVVGGLLVIAFVVPMAQYYAYVAKK